CCSTSSPSSSSDSRACRGFRREGKSTMSRISSDRAPRRRRDVVVAAACGAFVGVMVGAAFAAVPFYNWFCRTTGFGGTTQVASVAPAGMLDRRITVRFDANVAPGLPWRFMPEVNSIDLRIGEVATVYYDVVN